MKTFQRDFIDLALSVGALKFGEYTLKSGRVSPYFFNAGEFKTGAAIAQLASCYAQAIKDAKISFDMIFGPAYKGIPLATAIALALYLDHQQDYPYAFNRKEAKDHGEGGVIVGAQLSGSVLLVDDVISAGTSVRESATLIEESGADFSAVAIALDRQERGKGELSAVQEVSQQFGIEVINIISLDELVTYLVDSDESYRQYLPKVEAYRDAFGV